MFKFIKIIGFKEKKIKFEDCDVNIKKGFLKETALFSLMALLFLLLLVCSRNTLFLLFFFILCLYAIPHCISVYYDATREQLSKYVGVLIKKTTGNQQRVLHIQDNIGHCYAVRLSDSKKFFFEKEKEYEVGCIISFYTKEDQQKLRYEDGEYQVSLPLFLTIESMAIEE